MQVCENARKAVSAELDRIERERGVEVLFAVESGSRAWGFASPDSDYDVRFVYRDPPERAFALHGGRHVIERSIDAGVGMDGPIDLVGWSLEKALRLGLKSNPQLAEWSRGEACYRADPEFFSDMSALARQASPRAMAWHHRGLASQVRHQYLARSEDPVGKKYLYAVRSLLAADWLIDRREPAGAPPVSFAQLRAETPLGPDIVGEIDALLAWKVVQDEGRGRRRFPVLDTWIDEMIDVQEERIPDLPDEHPDPELAEAIWRRHYPEAFGREPVAACEEVCL